MLLDALDIGGIWSVSRGLARNVEAYKSYLAACDLKRHKDLDDRCNLSEETLIDFTRFFLGICLDQVKFMEEFVQPDKLRTRILLWAEEETRLGNCPPKLALSLKPYFIAANCHAATLLAFWDSPPAMRDALFRLWSSATPLISLVWFSLLPRHKGTEGKHSVALG